MSNFNVSVVIPVKNEAKKIKRCLDAILSQSVKVFEIIVLDSGSTDGTLDILKKYNEVKIINIPPDEFNHGTTRNIGIREAKGDFILMTVGDAIAQNNKWIEHLLSGFDTKDVACVYGQQIVPNEKDANPMEWFRPVTLNPTSKKYKAGNREIFQTLSPEEKKQYATIDNVTAMYRAEIIKKMPFPKVIYGEDIIWGKKAQENAYAIVFNPNARVYHYHITNVEFNYKRTFAVSYLRYKLFNYIPQRDIDTLYPLRVIKRLFFEKQISLVAKLKWFFYNIEQKKAINKALQIFVDTVKNPQKLEELYEKINGNPPIPIK